LNRQIASLLRDLASVQKSTQSKWGYKRAASAVLNLEQPIESFLQPDGTLRKIPNIGPSSTRIILEVLRTGSSATVEAAVAGSGRGQDIEKSRGLPANFLSRAQVVAALKNSKLRGPKLADYRGDLQMHSEWSDGSPSVAEIAAAGLARGWQFAAVTDHSYGLKIAGGMSMTDAAKQQREIDTVNRTHRGAFRLIKGVEANIDKEGALDLGPDEIRQFELVLAAPHSQLRKSHDQTPRLLRAVATPGVHILAHPRGRVTGTRAGIVANWPRVTRAAAKARVAIEIDGFPSRQDLDFELAHRALDAGCTFALDSDAHDAAAFIYTDTSIAHARLASIPPERVINCWDLPKLLDWLDRGVRL